MKPEWKKMAAQMRGELDRSKISRTQARVLEVLIKATLMRGRQSVIIPRLEDLGAVLLLSKGKLSEVFNGQGTGSARQPGLGMNGFRMVTVRELTPVECRERQLAFGAAHYTVMPDATQWAVDWVYEVQAMQMFLQGLDAVVGQVQGTLFLPEMTLTEARAEVSAENALKALGSRIRNELVPESGTLPPNVPTFNRSNVPTNKRDVNVDVLKGAVRQFVGADDFEKNWQSAEYIWGNEERCVCLDATLKFVIKGVSNGEIKIKRTRGAALWFQTRVDWEKHNRTHCQ